MTDSQQVRMFAVEQAIRLLLNLEKENTSIVVDATTVINYAARLEQFITKSG